MAPIRMIRSLLVLASIWDRWSTPRLKRRPIMGSVLDDAFLRYLRVQSQKEVPASRSRVLGDTFIKFVGPVDPSIERTNRDPDTLGTERGRAFGQKASHAVFDFCLFHMA